MIQMLAALLMSAATAPQAAAETPAPTPAPATVLAPGSRMEAYEQFRALYDTGHFDEALPFARRVVELSETDFERDYELPIAYNNLGATLFRLGDYEAAVESYLKSLEMLEASQGISSRRLIVPLAGLGAVYAASDQHVLAAELLDRALAVSRRADGLFNLEQLPLIEQAVDSRFAINDFKSVERERLYALKIAEQNFGYNDERTLPAIMKLAHFYEALQEYVAARLMYLRAQDVAAAESGGYNPMVITSLVGIARTHRLQYSVDPQAFDDQQPGREALTDDSTYNDGDVIDKMYDNARIPAPGASRNGIKAAQLALELLRGTPDPPRALLLQTLVELGDWFQIINRPATALPYYSEAAALVANESDPSLGNPLLVPRLIYYRRPVAATRGLNTPTGQYVIRRTVFRFDVAETGETRNITVSQTDMSEGQLSHSQRALARAIYSPRFADGVPVATQDVSYTAEWYESQVPAKSASPPVSEPAPEPASTTGG